MSTSAAWPWADLETPVALIDQSRMQANIARMQTRMQSLGVAFRPHVKTSKCIEVAQAQRAAGARGITVSTLKEAEQFFAAGFDDILYAVCLAPNKIAHALRLCAQGLKLQVVVDSVPAAQALAAALTLSTQRPAVLIEVDTDGHRSGVKPESQELLDVAAVFAQAGIAVHGVMTHAGSSYDLNTPSELQRMAEQERSLCVRAAQRLRAAGHACPTVSVGSTPTALSARSLEGVTEVRAGVYVFFDLVMAGVGVCRVDDIALSVLTTVIGHQADKGWVIVDAGWMAMSRDRGTSKQAVDQGYGLVRDERGQALDGVLMTGANQEHGIVSARDGLPRLDVARFPIGTRLRVLPNHACATGAQFPQYEALDEHGGLHTWPRFYGW
jgi:D-serine deaminase-like pyridoxal phosphate-dependent protein